MAAREEFDANDDDDDDGEEMEEKGKKKKGKKKDKLLKIDRNVLINKLMKKCSPSYRMFDKQQDVDVFR